MALYMQAFAGLSPIGNVQAGLLATLFGAPWSMAIGALVAGLALVVISLVTPEVFGARRAGTSTRDFGGEAQALGATEHRSERTPGT
jgi:hypothetical protein